MQNLTPRSLAQAALPLLMSALMLSAAPAIAAQDSDPTEVKESYGITIESENHRFQYSYPKALAREPALSAYLDRKGLEEGAGFSADSDRDHAEIAAKAESGYRLNPYEHQVEWSEEAEIPAYISLSRHTYSYLGGAHGMSVTTSMLWDKAGDEPVEVLTLFSGKANLDQAVQKAFCAQLNIQRAEKRGHPIPANSDDGFEQCITPSDQTVILGSSKGGNFDTLSINVAPYEAGPYVEGSYEVDLPVTQAVIRALKPEYRSHFAVR